MTGATCVLLLASTLLLAAPAPAGTKSSTASSRNTAAGARSKSSRKSSKRSRHTWRSRGQKTIDAARAREIQQALIREGYLDGAPSGEWDARSKDAMARYQADHGWQNKVVPDSRALIKLGLGPSTANLLPPDNATSPATPSAGGDKPAASSR